MWENVREDGTRKLKRNVAVPTLFTEHETNNIRGNNGNVRATYGIKNNRKIQYSLKIRSINV